MQPKVSVIIPVYNTEKYLRQCLDSVINQTLKEIEIICVDDGSTDGSLEILKEYAGKDGRINIYQQENLFAGVARNNGMRHAKGEYIFFMDSDDYCDISLLFKTYNIAQENDADVVVFNHYRQDEINGKRTEVIDVNKNLIKNDLKSFSYRNFPKRIMSIVNPVPWNKLIKKDLIYKYNLKFESTSSTNDITFAALCIAVAYKIYYFNEYLVTYRCSTKNSITSQKHKKLNNVIYALLKLYFKSKELPYFKEIEESVQLFTVNNLMYALNHYCGEKDSEAYRTFYNEMGKIFFGLPLFYEINKTWSNDKKILSFVNECKSISENNFDMKYFPKIIISLTSWKKRISTVHKTIQTLLSQTLKPYKIVLYLASSEFPYGEKELPNELKKLKSEIFEIKWTDDIKSYKKLIPAIAEFKNEIIITVDDDLLFSSEMIEKLVRGYREKPKCIQCCRVTTIEYNNINDIKTYPSNTKVYSEPTYLHKLSGGAGCLYPPNCFYSDVLDIDKFSKLAPTSDDLWFWLMAVLRGYKVNVIEGDLYKLKYIPGTQDVGLYHVNDEGDKLFFSHLRNILHEYPILQDILFYEQFYISHKNISNQKKRLDTIKKLKIYKKIRGGYLLL